MNKIKREIQDLILRGDFQNNPAAINSYPPKRLVNTLISLLYHPDELVKERSIKALGIAVSNIADNDFEYARTVIRRLMLSLTEESGGIGWGAPQAMGEIMARNYQLAQEYHQMLISYTPGGGNDLDFEELQKDVISGLRRLAKVYPNLVEEVKHLL
jgi:hypothetical protein